MVRWAETEARFWAIIWESEWREDLESLSYSPVSQVLWMERTEQEESGGIS